MFPLGADRAIELVKELNVNFILDYSLPESPSETAFAVLKAGALGAPRLYYPYLVARPLSMFCNIFPETINFIFRKLLSYAS